MVKSLKSPAKWIGCARNWELLFVHVCTTIMFPSSILSKTQLTKLYVCAPKGSVVSYSAGGTGHSEISLFLKDDGTVWGAGRNELGQLGQAPPGDMNPTPVLVSRLPTFVWELKVWNIQSFTISWFSIIFACSCLWIETLPDKVFDGMWCYLGAQHLNSQTGVGGV